MNLIFKYVFLILAIGSIAIFGRNIFMLIFSMDNYSIHKKRLKQLQFNNKKLSSDEEQTKEIIDKVTTPIITYILPKIKLRDMDEIQRDLKMAKWDKYFSPKQYLAMNILLKIIGIVVLILLLHISIPFALIWFLALFFLMGFLFKNSVKERKSKLLSQFPDFIRITQGYLTADVPFVKAVEQSINYVGEEWKPVLQDFIINCDIKSIEEAIDTLQKDIDIFEVRELLSLIKLNLDQGIDVKESFDRQAEKVRDLQLEVLMNKIAKRQMMAIILQGPLLLVLIGSFGLPTFYSMTTFSSI